jgi:lysozyme
MPEIINGIPMEKGNDISKYNEVIDWPALKSSGHKYTIIRSGQGPSYKDPLFTIHRNNAIANGLPWGVYHFFDYRWPDGATHFQNMKSVVGSNFGNIAPSIDLETLYNYIPGTKKKPGKSIPIPISCGRNAVYAELMEFGSMLFHETGNKPMLYVGNLLGWLKPDEPFMDMFDLWFAYWNAIPGKTTPFIDWKCWQRIGDVALPGQSGAWDIDYVKDADWAGFIGDEDPVMPLPDELSFEEKFDRLWDWYSETH